jgi:hypothetical protein
MFCKNCGKQIPDNAAHCPNCGAANDAAAQAPAQAAAPAPAPAPAAAPNPFSNAGKSALGALDKANIKFDLKKIIPVLMVFYIIMGIFGTYHTEFMKTKYKYQKWSDWSRTSFSAVCDESDEDDSIADNGFTKFVKFIEVVATIGAVAGLAGWAFMYISKKYNFAVLSLGASAVFLLFGRLFLFIEAFYLKGKLKDEMEKTKVKGGPTWTLIFWMLFLLIFIVGSYVVASSLKNDDDSKAPAKSFSFGK